ncbi:short-chain dehydrogenase [Geomicrobium sp. JSM 1781026]|uniref:short-chain dehydrogenase n=1 Tax=Geomicrobium sp. JSM 1781026 TaxID=3344580 RepID=UPI0035C246A0
MNLGHALIFGGTGMLAGATKWVAEHATHATAFGRNEQRLHRLEQTSAALGTRQLDYTDSEQLKQEVQRAYDTFGPIHTVVAWIHGTAPGARSLIVEQIDRMQADVWQLVTVRGSSHDVQQIKKEQNIVSEQCRFIDIQLGFIYDGRVSRWLTHDEISAGVIRGIKDQQAVSVVGTLEPWDERP